MLKIKPPEKSLSTPILLIQFCTSKFTAQKWTHVKSWACLIFTCGSWGSCCLVLVLGESRWSHSKAWSLIGQGLVWKYSTRLSRTVQIFGPGIVLWIYLVHWHHDVPRVGFWRFKGFGWGLFCERIKSF